MSGLSACLRGRANSSACHRAWPPSRCMYRRKAAITQSHHDRASRRCQATLKPSRREGTSLRQPGRGGPPGKHGRTPCSCNSSARRTDWVAFLTGKNAAAVCHHAEAPHLSKRRSSWSVSASRPARGGSTRIVRMSSSSHDRPACKCGVLTPRLTRLPVCTADFGQLSSIHVSKCVASPASEAFVASSP